MKTEKSSQLSTIITADHKHMEKSAINVKSAKVAKESNKEKSLLP